MLRLALFGETIAGFTVSGLMLAWIATSGMVLYRTEQWLSYGMTTNFYYQSVIDRGEVALINIRYWLAAGTAYAIIHMLSGIRAGLMR